MANLAMLALSVVAIVAVFISLRAEEDETGDGEDTELPSFGKPRRTRGGDPVTATRGGW